MPYRLCGALVFGNLHKHYGIVLVCCGQNIDIRLFDYIILSSNSTTAVSVPLTFYVSCAIISSMSSSLTPKAATHPVADHPSLLSRMKLHFEYDKKIAEVRSMLRAK